MINMMRAQADAAVSTPPEDMTRLILAIFRANGALLAAGDRLVAGLGLTSARWQLLGSIAEEEQPLSVAQLARKMGVTRQAVQRIVNELQKNGMIAFRTNPHHRRAQLIVLTKHGQNLFERAMQIQQPWVTTLGFGIPAARGADLRETLDLLLTTLDAIDTP